MILFRAVAQYSLQGYLYYCVLAESESDAIQIVCEFMEREEPWFWERVGRQNIDAYGWSGEIPAGTDFLFREEA